METYLLKQITKNDPNAMYGLGFHYQYQNKNCDLMKKYYLMGIQHNCISSLHCLVNYYIKNKITIQEINILLPLIYNFNFDKYDFVTKKDCDTLISNLDLNIELNKIKEHMKKINYEYCEINNNISIINIYNLFINNILFDPSCDTENLYLGIYYMSNTKLMNIKLGLKYFTIAIDNGNSGAMYLMGNYYCNATTYDDMIKYYDDNKTNLMKIYYLMAIEKNHGMAMYKLGHYYYLIENYKLMEKYYLSAITNNIIEAMYKLGKYYYDITGLLKIMGHP